MASSQDDLLNINHYSADEASTIQDDATLRIPIPAQEGSESIIAFQPLYDESQSSPFFRSLNIIKKGLKSIIVFTNRLWLSYIILIFIQLIIKRISNNFGSEILSPTLLYQITSKNVTPTVYLADGTPALFGKVIFEPITTNIVHIDSEITDFCSPIDSSLVLYLKNRNETFALVPRGGCPFERKAYYIQESGFSGAMIYNSLNSPTQDLPIRMSSFIGLKINITCMYLTFASQLRLKSFLNRNVIITPHDWYFIPAKTTISSSAFEFIQFSINLWKFSISFLLICFISILLYNLVTKRELQLLETMQYCSEFLLDEGVSYPAAKLIYIPFPKRILTIDDISCMNSSNYNCEKSNCKKMYNNSCCAICIEDFSAGDSVRDLPCGHIYHCAW